MRSMMTRLILVLAIGSVASGSPLAGDLEPPGSPAPTMVTLQEIYDLIQSQGSLSVARTGQTGCWDEPGTPVACAGTGQDGEYQAGVSVSPRFTDNGDGTVKDHLTGLIWLKNAGCFGLGNWADDLSDANTLADGSCGLTDGSAAGDWRLPNVRELHSLIDFQHSSPALPTGHPFSLVQSIHYWSSTTDAGATARAWNVHLGSGNVGNFFKTSFGHVWPVRDGQ